MRERKSSALQSSSDNHDRSAQKDSLSTAKNVTDPDATDCAEETSNVVRCDGDAWLEISWETGNMTLTHTLNGRFVLCLALGEARSTLRGGVYFGENCDKRG